jgi:hypothetical protein
VTPPLGDIYLLAERRKVASSFASSLSVFVAVIPSVLVALSARYLSASAKLCCS